MLEPARLYIRKQYIGCLLPAAAVFGGFVLLLILEQILGPIAPEIEKFEFETIPSFPESLELNDRYEIVATGLWWLFWTYAFWIVATLSIGSCCWTVNGSLSEYNAKTRLVIFIIIFLGLSLVALWFTIVGSLVSGQDLVKVIEEVAERSNVLMTLTNGFAILVIILIVISSCIALVPRQNQGDVSQQIKNLNILLYTAAIVILVWMTQARIMYGFAATLLVPEQQELVERMAPTVSLIVGAVASIYIALLYLAGLVWLQSRHSQLQTVGSKTVQLSDEANKKSSPVAILLSTWPRMIAVLGPVLPGIAEAFFGFGDWI